MGTRADFYVKDRDSWEWLGSVSMDGGPRSLGWEAVTATTEVTFRGAVARVLSDPEVMSTFPDEGWPWPWEDSRTTDYAYAWDQVLGQVILSRFGRKWVTSNQYLVNPDVVYEGEKMLAKEVLDMSGMPRGDVWGKSGLLVYVGR